MKIVHGFIPQRGPAARLHHLPCRHRHLRRSARRRKVVRDLGRVLAARAGLRPRRQGPHGQTFPRGPEGHHRDRDDHVRQRRRLERPEEVLPLQGRRRPAHGLPGDRRRRDELSGLEPHPGLRRGAHAVRLPEGHLQAVRHAALQRRHPLPVPGDLQPRRSRPPLGQAVGHRSRPHDPLQGPGNRPHPHLHPGQTHRQPCPASRPTRITSTG